MGFYMKFRGKYALAKERGWDYWSGQCQGCPFQQ